MEQAWTQGASCADPPALSEIALIAFIDGEAEPYVLNHIHSCTHCSARAHALAQLQQNLRGQLYRIFCPSSDLLIEYGQGLLPFNQWATIAKHLAICPHCAQEIAFMEQAVGG